MPAGRYPPVALLVEVDPHQVDVNVHPTKQLVRFSDEKEVRQAISEALRNAIGGAGDPAPDQEGPNTRSETPSATLPPATESGFEAPLAEPERPPTEKHPANETPAPVPTAKDRPATRRRLDLFGEPFRDFRGLQVRPTKGPRPLGATQAHRRSFRPLSRAGSQTQ